NAFISHEAVAVLIVILTITLASVANIHLALSRINRNLLRIGVTATVEIRAARRELNQNAWTLFWAFIACGGLLLIKGQWTSDLTILSFVHGGVLVIFAINLLALHDIYSAIYRLVTFE